MQYKIRCRYDYITFLIFISKLSQVYQKIRRYTKKMETSFSSNKRLEKRLRKNLPVLQWDTSENASCKFEKLILMPEEKVCCKRGNLYVAALLRIKLLCLSTLTLKQPLCCNFCFTALWSVKSSCEWLVKAINNWKRTTCVFYCTIS